MTDAIGDFNDCVWEGLEDSLTPPLEDSFVHHFKAFLYLPAALVTSSLALIAKVVEFSVSFFKKIEEVDPNTDFTAVLKDSRKWEEIKGLGNPVDFGPDFLFGVATCTYQDSGSVSSPNSQWTQWEEACLPPENRSGASARLFEMYQTPEGRQALIERLHKIHATAYRFSIEWSQIEPNPGEFHAEVLDHYVALAQALRDEGIVPVVTLHHFSEPTWFHAAGSFENEENHKAFLKFVEFVFPKLTEDYLGAPLVPYIIPINEPGIEAFSRFVSGAFSPGKMFNFAQGARFLKGAIKAHQAVYEKFHNDRVKIGYVHQKLRMEAANPLLIPVVRYVNRLVDDVTLQCFETGHFDFHMPFVRVEERDLHPKADFVGLQYYVRPVAGLMGSISYHEPMTLMPFREDPEGIYEAILAAQKAFQVPVFITENGISTNDEVQRARYFQRALYATQRARDVVGQKNVMGYLAWSFCDNSEWNRGWDPQKFGVYGVSGVERILDKEPKPGVAPLIAAAKKSQESLPKSEVA